MGTSAINSNLERSGSTIYFEDMETMHIVQQYNYIESSILIFTRKGTYDVGSLIVCDSSNLKQRVLQSDIQGLS